MELSKMHNKFSTKKFLRMIDLPDKEVFHDQEDYDTHTQNDFQFWQKIWEEAGNVQKFNEINVTADWKLVRDRMDTRFPLHYKKLPLGTYFVRIAALFILTCGLSIGFYKLILVHKDSNTGFTQYSADNSIKEIVLPDGSTVTLNTGSNLTFREGFGINSREVILNGEAFFNVVPGANLPFRVFSGESVVEVTGTRFSVYEADGKVQVSVVSGRVLLSSKDSSQKKISIAANQSGYLLSNNELKIEEGIPANTLSWKTRDLIFEQTPIDSALIDIARYFSRDLTVDTGINDEITAEFHDQPLSEILDELSLVAGLRFDTTGTALIVRK